MKNYVEHDERNKKDLFICGGYVYAIDWFAIELRMYEARKPKVT